MSRLLVFLATTIGGYIGWWAGDSLGFGLMGALLASGLGSLAGIVAAWKITVEYLD